MVKPRKPANKVTIFQLSPLTGLMTKAPEEEEEELLLEEPLAAATLAVWTKLAEEEELAIVNVNKDLNLSSLM